MMILLKLNIRRENILRIRIRMGGGGEGKSFEFVNCYFVCSGLTPDVIICCLTINIYIARPGLNYRNSKIGQCKTIVTPKFEILLFSHISTRNIPAHILLSNYLEFRPLFLNY